MEVDEFVAHREIEEFLFPGGKTVKAHFFRDVLVRGFFDMGDLFFLEFDWLD